jgi:hypothetical protein
VVNSGITDNLTKVIMHSVPQYGGLLESNPVLKLVSFGANGVLVFQGAESGVTTQFKKKFVPYMLRGYVVLHTGQT